MAEKFFSDASEPRMEREKTAACRPILLLVLYNRVVIRGLSGDYLRVVRGACLYHLYPNPIPCLSGDRDGVPRG